MRFLNNSRGSSLVMSLFVTVFLAIVLSPLVGRLSDLYLYRFKIKEMEKTLYVTEQISKMVQHSYLVQKSDANCVGGGYQKLDYTYRNAKGNVVDTFSMCVPYSSGGENRYCVNNPDYYSTEEQPDSQSSTTEESQTCVNYEYDLQLTPSGSGGTASLRPKDHKNNAYMAVSYPKKSFANQMQYQALTLLSGLKSVDLSAAIASRANAASGSGSPDVNTVDSGNHVTTVARDCQDVDAGTKDSFGDRWTADNQRHFDNCLRCSEPHVKCMEIRICPPWLEDSQCQSNDSLYHKQQIAIIDIDA